MTRRTVTLTEAILAEFAQLIVLVENLLVKNKNFETGYYFRTYPTTRDYVKVVLSEQGSAITCRIKRLKEVVAQAMELEPEALDTAGVAAALSSEPVVLAAEGEYLDGLRAKFEERAFSQYFLSTIQRTGQGGPFELVSKDALMKVDFVARNADGSYKQITLNPAWWAWKESIRVTQTTTSAGTIGATQSTGVAA